MKVSKLCTFAPVHVFHTKIKSLLPRFCYLLLLLRASHHHHHHHHRNETLPAVLRLSHQLNVNDVALLIATTKTPLPFLLLLPHRRPHRFANRNVVPVAPSLPRSIQMDRLYRTQTRSPKVQISFRNSQLKHRVIANQNTVVRKSVTEKGGSVF